MARFGCNFWKHRPMPQPDHVWAIAHTLGGRGRLEWKDRARTGQSLAEAQALIEAGQVAWCGRDLWDEVYAWWEGQEKATEAADTAPVSASTAVNCF
jgi:hypothetical protein